MQFIALFFSGYGNGYGGYPPQQQQPYGYPPPNGYPQNQGYGYNPQAPMNYPQGTKNLNFHCSAHLSLPNLKSSKSTKMQASQTPPEIY